MPTTKLAAKKRERIAVVIPCYNEEAGIAQVIERFPHDKITRNLFDIKIYVVDNNSTDRTAEVAREAGAIVLSEKKKGKGNALRTGFKHAVRDSDYVVMLDGDDTYCPEEILRLVEPLRNNFCDVVIGSRLDGNIEGDSMKRFNMMGNHIFTHLVRIAYRAPVTDVLTGYFAWRTPVIKKLYPLLVSDGFAIEMEMITKMARMNYHILSFPITYLNRAGDSNLSPVGDGWRILRMWLRNLSWRAPERKSRKHDNPMTCYRRLQAAARKQFHLDHHTVEIEQPGGPV